MTLSAENKRQHFRECLRGDELIIIPGAFNAICARFVEEAGFPATYVSGAATAAAAFALPDLGMVTLTEAVSEAGRIANAVQIPTLADADTGFGEMLNVGRTVREFEAAGVTGIHLEDQVFPKRCGHLDGKEVISTTEMVAKIRLAVEARRDPNFLIIARSDACSVNGFADMLDRCRSYADAGAELIFPEALTTLGEYEKAAAALPVPILANMTEFGKTPYYRAKEFGEVGCKVVLFPLSILRHAMGGVRRALATLHDEGSQEPLVEEMFSRQEFYEFIDYAAYERRSRG